VASNDFNLIGNEDRGGWRDHLPFAGFVVSCAFFRCRICVAGVWHAFSRSISATSSAVFIDASS
jgi:hypothetical protein